MLTLKEPIKLNISDGILTVSEAFNEKLKANYGLMQAQFSPKELLLLLTAQADSPQAQAGMTSIAVNNNTLSVQNANLDIINNAVNRILLSDNADFTYQDQVYITTVLQKLGITDVSEFMKQVRNLTEDNRSVYRLLKLYQDNSELFTQLSANMREHLAGTPDKSTQDTQEAADNRYFIAGEIYNRLGIAEIYSVVNSFQRNQALSLSNINSNELKTAEQLRVCNSLLLSQTKQRIFEHDSVSLQHHINHYEFGDILPPPQTEQQVLVQGAAASLLSLIDNVMVSSLSRSKKEIWIDIKSSVSASVGNSLNRFEAYHSESSVKNQLSVFYSEQINSLYHEEIGQINSLLEQFNQYGGGLSIAATDLHTQVNRLALEHRALTELEDNSVTVDESVSQTKISLSNESIAQLTQKMLSGNAPENKIPGMPPAGEPVVAAERQTAPAELIFSAGEEQIKVIEQLSQTEQLLALTQQQQFSKEISFDMRELFSDVLKYSSDFSTLNLTQSGLEVYKNEANAIYGDLIFDDHSQSISEAFENTESAVQINTDKTEVLRERLNVINQRNKDILERLQAQIPEQIKKTPAPTPDRKKIQSEALRALENPEQVIREMMEGAPAASSRAEAQLPEIILTNADENTKKIFEAVIKYRQNPQAAMEEGLIRPSDVAAFNAEMLTAEKQNAAVEMTHPDAENEQESAIERAFPDAGENTKEIIDAALKYRQKPQGTAEAQPGNRSGAPVSDAEGLEAEKQGKAEMTHLSTEKERITEEIINTVKQAGQAAQPAALKHRPENQSIESIVAKTDENTRKIYEAVLKYQQDPRAAIEAGLVRPADTQAFNAEIHKAIEENNVELTYRTEAHERETQGIHDTVEHVVDQFREVMGNATASERAATRPRVPIIHRETETTEEYSQHVEQQSREETKQLSESVTVTQGTFSQAQINNASQEMIAKTTEDITEIINRTLARQIGTISDRVYSQMEKRLQGERARRGRF